MNSPAVGQLQFLSSVFKSVMSEYHPTRVLIVGCTTGNGFEHIDFDAVEHVAAVDINPEYLSVLRERYNGYMQKIELVCSDINACAFQPKAFDLIHCALLFEYVDPAETVRNIARWLSCTGVLTVVLQLRDDVLKKVSDSPFSSLKRLDAIMHLLEPEEFNEIALSNGLEQVRNEVTQLQSGKKFSTAVYAAATRFNA